MAETWSDEAYYDEYYGAVPQRRWSTLALILSGLVGVLLGFACAACLAGVGLAILLLLPAGETAGATSLTPAPVTSLPTPPGMSELGNPPPVPAETPFVSGGLGLSQPEWEQRHGPGSPDPSGSVMYENGAYLVTFQDGNVWRIERLWSPEGAATFDAARLQSVELLPADRQYVQTYNPDGRPELITDLYLSQSLRTRFNASWWAGGEPGSFSVTFTVSDYGVGRMVAGLGNNP